VLNVSGVFPEWEMSVVGSDLARSQSDRISSLVEGGTKVVESVKGDPWQGHWHRLGELDLMRILRALRVCFNDDGIWLTAEEGHNLPFEIVNVSLGVLDAIS